MDIVSVPLHGGDLIRPLGSCYSVYVCGVFMCKLREVLQDCKRKQINQESGLFCRKCNARSYQDYIAFHGIMGQKEKGVREGGMEDNVV